MRREPFPAAALALLAVIALAACGASTKTVTEGGPPRGEASASTSTGPGATGSTAPSTGTTQSGQSANGGATAPSTTRTAPEPAFAQQENVPQETQAAAAVVHSHGYTPADVGEYHPNQTLRLLVGTRSGSADGYGQQVFFFVDGHFIGTDASEPSAAVKVVSQNDTEAVVAYSLYRPGDPLSSPSGGRALVHFQLDNGKLVPLQAIPAVRAAGTPSRL
jgi:hypothetical protein